MGIVQAFVTVGGLVALVGVLVFLFCHYLGGWTWTKAWLRSSGEEKMVLTRAGNRHFNPNGYMVSSESDLNLSGRGSFRRFDTTDNDYQLFRQGSTSSLVRTQGPSSISSAANFIPPQPLRPAPILPSISQSTPPIVGTYPGQLTSQSSLDSVFNTAPNSPAYFGGAPVTITSLAAAVPRIPPPPQQQQQHNRSGSTSSVSSHASQRSSFGAVTVTMGDGNPERAMASGCGSDSNDTPTSYSSTNPFLPLLQASSQFLTQTVQSFQTTTANQDLQQDHQTVASTVSTGDTTSTSGSGSVSSVPPGSAGLSMGELLFSAPPSYQSTNLPPAAPPSAPVSNSAWNSEEKRVVESDSVVGVHVSGARSASYPNAATATRHHSSPNPLSRPVVPVVGVRSMSTGSPQHARYNLYHQTSGENSTSPVPTAHSPPPTKAAPGIRRASYPKYAAHDAIPKSEFPQHIPYIPSHHHHHHHLSKSGAGVPGATGSTERKIGVINEVIGPGVVIGPYSDPLRHPHLHHYLPSTGAANVQPFLEEQEEPPEEPCTNHQLDKSQLTSTLETERDDLTNRIMLETMREEIRIANEKMADATKSLMMDDVFLPTTGGSGINSNNIHNATSNTNTNTSNSNNLTGSNSQNEESPRKRVIGVPGGDNLSLSLSSSSASSSLPKPGEEPMGQGSTVGVTTTVVATTSVSISTVSSSAGVSASQSQQGRSTEELRKSFGKIGEGISTLNSSLGNLRRSSTPNSRVGAMFTGYAARPTTLLHRQRSNDELPQTQRGGPPQPPICVNNRDANQETDGRRGGKLSREMFAKSLDGNASSLVRNGFGNGRLLNFNSASLPNSQSELQHQHHPSQNNGGFTTGNCIVSNNIAGSCRPPTVGSYFKQNSRSFSLRQSSTDSIGSDSDLSSPTDGSLPSLERAMSCDSVCSDTSVILGDLDPPHMTGHLCIGLEYDSETADLLVNVMEAKELVGPDPDPNAPFDSYVRVYLLPDKTTNMQTRVYRKSLCPVYKEKFMFGLEMSELANRSLVFYLYATDKYTNTLIGEAELKLGDIDLSQSVVTWLLLTDTGQRGGEFGEIMFSLSYLPTAERLTVVVVKARNLKFPHEKETGDPFVKVYLLQKGKKVSKKKSSTKRGEKNPIFNEAMIFSIPAHALQTIQLRITVADSLEAEGRAYSIGHVIVGSVATGKPLSHWNQMLSSLRKPIAMWHALRK